MENDEDLDFPTHRSIIRARRKSARSYDIGACVGVEDYTTGSAVSDYGTPDAAPLLFGTTEWAALRAAL